MYHSLVLVVLIFQTVFSVKLPANWVKCPRTDNSECMKTAVRDAIKDLTDGNPSVGVIPMDPLHFERLVIEQGGSSPVTVNLTFYNVDLVGFKNLEIDEAKADWDNNRLEFNLHLTEPGMVLGDYTISGKVLVLPIQGDGKANITMYGFTCKLVLDGKTVKKGDKTHFSVESVEFVIDPKKIYVYFGNLFNGVPNLGEQMNVFLNKNWKIILEEMKVTISLAMGEAFKQISNNLFLKVPLEDIIAN